MARYLNLVAALAATGVFAITPEQMLSAPRRGEAIPNPTGEIAFFSVSQYSFEKQKTASAWKLLDLKTGDIKDLGLNASEVSEIAWLPGTENGIIYVNSTNEDNPGGVSIWIGDATGPSASKLAASLDAPFSGLKVANTSSGDLHILLSAMAYPNGTVYNKEFAPKPRNTGRLYSDIYPRHWDSWLTKQRSAVFAGILQANSSYSLAQGGMRNLLQNVNYTVTRPESPVQPFGGSGDYDISPDGKIIAFLSKATHLNKANYTASYIYVGPFDGSLIPAPINGPDTKADEEGHQGASAIPTFSPDSSKLAYLQQDGIFYESDRQKLYIVDVSCEDDEISITNWHRLAADWDRSPDNIQWAPDGKSFFVSAEDFAIERIFNIPLTAGDDYTPKNLTGVTSVAAFHILPNSSFLVSSSSVWSSRDYYISSANGPPKMIFSSTVVDPELAGLSRELYEEFFYTGSQGVQLHALIVKPTNFTSNKTYPLAYIIHGGPQGSNANSWSTRWNFQVWADQGYVVVAPNPTGSTGFGQELTDTIQGNWGSYPYEDIVLGWEYIDANLSYVDTANGIEAGASYGGYMTNWIQGHDLGRKFKALVTHDGVSNTLADYATEELWFIQHDNNGTIWNNRANYEKYNPLNHILNFSTPHFVVHNTLDYRLPESDGLALFNILQSRGIPSRFLNFPDENHHVLDAENSLFWHQEIFNWINFYSGIGGPLDDIAVGF